MNYEQKALAMCALGWSKFEIKIRDAGNWYATCAAEIKDGPMLSSAMGNGKTPEAAVDALWAELTELRPGAYLVVNAYSETRAAVKWNGFMWEPVVEKTAA